MPLGKLFFPTAVKSLLLFGIALSALFLGWVKAEAATLVWQISTPSQSCIQLFPRVIEGEVAYLVYSDGEIYTIPEENTVLGPYNDDGFYYYSCSPVTMVPFASFFAASDKDIYAPGETATVSIAATLGDVSSSRGFFDYLFNPFCIFGCSSIGGVGASATYINTIVYCDASGSCSNTGSFRVPSRPGSYAIVLNGCAPGACAPASIAFTVSAAAAAPVVTPAATCAANQGSACSSAANACGQTTSGTIQCDGSCSVSTAPANSAGYGSACTSSANVCGQTQSNGTIQCNGSCSSTAPSNAGCSGGACTSTANACGQTNGTYNGSGTCISPAVTIPGGNTYGTSCVSGGNACGQTQSNGTWQCNGSCSSTPPSNTSCLSDLTAATPNASPSSPSVGQSITLSSLISNIAAGPANGSFPNLFRINTSSLLSGSSINSLAGGASANTTASYTPTAAGTYTVSACADNNTSWQGSITESNEGNNCSANASFTAVPCTASLTSVPSTIEQGQSTTLSWSPSSSYCGFTSATFADGASYGGCSGTRTVTPSTTSTYGLSCIGPYNPAPGTSSTYSTVTVLVPTATLTANGQSSTARVNPSTPNNTVVAWSSTNSASCAVTKNGAAWRTGLSSAGITETVTTQTVYAIDCVNNHGTHATGSVTVNLLAGFEEF